MIYLVFGLIILFVLYKVFVVVFKVGFTVSTKVLWPIFAISLVVAIVIGTITSIYNMFALHSAEPVALDRDAQGYFIVSKDNFDEYGVIKTAKPYQGIMLEKFAFRSYPDHKSDYCPDGIVCDNYKSKFIEIDSDTSNVVIIETSDDEAFTQWRNTYIQSVDEFNQSIVQKDFNADISYTRPEIPVWHIESFGSASKQFRENDLPP